MSEVTVEQAEEYFEEHLEAAAWAALDEVAQQALLNMAEPEILVHLRGQDAIDATDTRQVAAVCEQALFLWQNRRALDSASMAVASGIQAESVDGLGSRSFRTGVGPGSLPALARNAQTQIRLLMGPPRFVRG
jgi:hypothetical protein